MSLLSHEIQPDRGFTFTINSQHEEEFERVRNFLLEIDGVREVEFNGYIFPHEFTVYTDFSVKIQEVESAVVEAGYHAYPKEDLMWLFIF